MRVLRRALVGAVFLPSVALAQQEGASGATPDSAASAPTPAAEATASPDRGPLVFNPSRVPARLTMGEASDTVRARPGFFTRLGHAYRDAWNAPAYSAPAPGDTPAPRRGLPASFDSPPLPVGDWQLGASLSVGDQNNSTVYPLMQALYDGPNGAWWRKSRFMIYGWADVGTNFSSSVTTNAPAAYAVRPRHIELDQFLLRFERKADEAQTDHFDWSFRFDNIYGLDYRYTTMKGVFSNQLLTKNNTYGYDPVMFYFDFYLPKIAQGTNIRVGRYISAPDIEAQLAPDNAMYTHSLLYSVDPYTQMGIVATTKLSKNWTIQLGVNAGNDVAIWQADERKLTGMACLQWISSANKDSFYGCVNSINKGQYGYNNLQDFVGTWTHKFSDRVVTATEAYYMYQKNVPAVGGPLPTITNANGAVCDPGQISCFAPEYAVLNQTIIRTGPNSFMTIRNEFLNDIRGQRTGFATLYTEHAIGFTMWPNKVMTVRPEFRYEHSYNTPAYDGGIKSNQVLAAVDVIMHF